MNKQDFILWFSEIGSKDTALVGGKNAQLGELVNSLVSKGIRVPDGFAVTAYAYRYFLETTGIKREMGQLLSKLNARHLHSLTTTGHAVRQLILKTDFPPELTQAIVKAYTQLCQRTHKRDVDVAVRSSATAEDLPEASFAGQQETFLNIRGAYEVVEATKRCFASLFTNRAISYRSDKGFDHMEVALSVGVQHMVRSDEAGAGVLFTLDTESGFRNAVVINANYGLGETVVQGKVDPDEYYVFKPTLLQGLEKTGNRYTFKYQPIIGKTRGSKEVKLIYSLEGSPTRLVPVSQADRQRFVLSDQEVLTLAAWACLIERHYQRPMDIEWAKDGFSGQLFIVQARPETVHAAQTTSVVEEYVLGTSLRSVLVEGVSVGSRIGSGPVRVIKDVEHMALFKRGEVLVTEITDPDWEPIMKLASAIVTNSGGRTSHAAIVARELGIPAVVGAGHATEKLKNGRVVTVSCAEGDRGFVYDGAVKFKVKKTDLKTLPNPKTKVMMIVADPSRAFDFSMIPNAGVGLCREELIIASHIQIHPLALLNPGKVKDPLARARMEELTLGYSHKADFFVDRLSEGVGRIVAAFWPKPVIVRLSDFKSNEYANLIGGKYFEPLEENPMLGWRGASRYYDPAYAPAFTLECQALRRVRENMGLTNLKIMVPFCRTPEEGKKVVQLLKAQGLVQGKNGLEIWVMCEIPANVILAKEFLKIFDGFSIGTNDLTQLVLGLDRDSALVAPIGDERNAAVKQLLTQVIKAVHQQGKQVGICGQAPSDYPEFAEFLIQQKIDSISLTPDTVMNTLAYLSKSEKRHQKLRRLHSTPRFSGAR